MRTPQSQPIVLVESYAPDDRVTLKLIGDLDATARGEVERRLGHLAARADATIDLARTTFVDLDAARMLVDCCKQARRNRRSFEIVNAGSDIERMLHSLDGGGCWRAQEPARHEDGEVYEVPGPTTVDAERSKPESQQIVRLECPACGHQTFLPERSRGRLCEKCGTSMKAVAVFRDRRRLDAPVEVDRRFPRG